MRVWPAVGATEIPQNIGVVAWGAGPAHATYPRLASMLLAYQPRMFVLPPRLMPGADDVVSGITCPACHGSLRVRAEGGGHLHFTCRIGHAYSLREMLEAHEHFLEDTVWTAVRSAEELQQLLRDVVEYRIHAPGDAPAANYEQRRRSAGELAAALRRLLERDEPIKFSAAEENGSAGQ